MRPAFESSKEAMFQSLIGWLQTVTTPSTTLTSSPFQSLIGWLQTLSGFRFGLGVMEFQSLIGWLQTTSIISKSRLIRKVSIPYRLATNDSNFTPAVVDMRSFQSLIGWLQTGASAEQLATLFPFQSLIGWLQTFRWFT